MIQCTALIIILQFSNLRFSVPTSQTKKENLKCRLDSVAPFFTVIESQINKVKTNYNKTYNYTLHVKIKSTLKSNNEKPSKDSFSIEKFHLTLHTPVLNVLVFGTNVFKMVR